MKTKDGRISIASWELREELETAWLRGWRASNLHPGTGHAELNEMAAFYAERVLGGSTRPERPA
jgi:hypothetical protein